VRVTDNEKRNALVIGIEHHRAGRLREAESLYRQVLQADPNQPDALHLLGSLALQAGDSPKALELTQGAIQLMPAVAVYHNTLGSVLFRQGQLLAAEQAYRRALSLDSKSPDTLNNLGNVVAAQSRIDEAVAAYQSALALRPNDAVTHYHLGIALKRLTRRDEAINAFRGAIRLDPNFAEAHNNLGSLLCENGDAAAAVETLKTAIRLRPQFAEALSNLAIALGETEDIAGARLALDEALRCDPTSERLQFNRAFFLQVHGGLDEAVKIFRDAVHRSPSSAVAQVYLGQALRDQGQLDEAIVHLRAAVDARPDDAAIRSNLIFTLHHYLNAAGEQIQAELAEYAKRHSDQLQPLVGSQKAVEEPNRQLRVGYVSADLHDHPVGRLMLLLLGEHDRTRFHITCYSNGARFDSISHSLRAAADQWCDIKHLSDRQVAESVRADRIDLLVDLSVHSSGNRLLVFALKPAPVQLTFAGYPGSTGLRQIDYRITDRYLEPPEAPDSDRYAEQPIRLPNSFWCFRSDDTCNIPIGDPPAASAGYLTFGCLNNFWKINEPMLELWARILRSVGSSRLLLLADPGTHRLKTARALEERGVDPKRVDFAERRRRRDYLELYNLVDISLDTVPYNGHATTLDSLWMGVPVVSLIGQLPVGRGGLSILSTAGLPELATSSADDYVHTAADLANDRDRLLKMRKTLRSRLLASPLMQAAPFTLDLENIFRSAWARLASARAPLTQTGEGMAQNDVA
jgi:predicted O-linked N-acetylglucosamine transferase (SPINDLY family)